MFRAVFLERFQAVLLEGSLEGFPVEFLETFQVVSPTFVYRDRLDQHPGQLRLAA